MKILFAADGSEFTRKALGFVVNHEELMGPDGELVVLNVQVPMSSRVIAMAGPGVVDEWHREEAGKVLGPINTFLDRHQLRFRSSWVVGHSAQEIVNAARAEKAHMIVMGSHGHGLFGRALLGSVSQQVLADSEVPVLVVR